MNCMIITYYMHIAQGDVCWMELVDAHHPEVHWQVSRFQDFPKMPRLQARTAGAAFFVSLLQTCSSLLG